MYTLPSPAAPGPCIIACFPPAIFFSSVIRRRIIIPSPFHTRRSASHIRHSTLSQSPSTYSLSPLYSHYCSIPIRTTQCRFALLIGALSDAGIANYNISCRLSSSPPSPACRSQPISASMLAYTADSSSSSVPSPSSSSYSPTRSPSSPAYQLASHYPTQPIVRLLASSFALYAHSTSFAFTLVVYSWIIFFAGGRVVPSSYCPSAGVALLFALGWRAHQWLSRYWPSAGLALRYLSHY